MIKPKHSFGKKNFVVNEEFIDREEAKKIYRSKLESNDKDYNVVVFYGVGGIGKSKLRKEICRIHEEEYKNSLIMYLDFNSADDRNLGSGILKLVDSCNVKIDFKCFELAYALYFRKKHPSLTYGRGKELVAENTFVGIGLNILSIIDSGITSTATEIVEKSIRAISNRTIDKEVKDELKRFDKYSITEMEEMLPLFFQYDLISFLNKHQDTKVLLVFDSFEVLNENVIEQIHRSKNERWVQEIISYFDAEQFPNLLITIFGRDEIEWDEEWKEILVQYPLKEFDVIYAKEYLEKAGVEEAAIINSIVKSSKGYPFLLYLSLETYANIKNRGSVPIVKDFEGTYPEIIERFLYNLDKDTVEVLRIISIPNYYNTEIFGKLTHELNISFPLTEFEQFNKYSFVSLDEREKEYYIHDLMRKGILERTSDMLIMSTHRILKEYYVEKTLKERNTKSFIELMYHARNALSLDEFNQWLQKPMEDGDTSPIKIINLMQKRGEQNTLIQIINGVLSKYKLNELLIDFVNVYIDIVHLGGDYEVAVDICEKYLSDFSDKEIYKNQQLLRMRIRQIHHSMFFKPVNALIDEGEKIIHGIDILKFPEEYNELLFLLGGNLGVLSGNFEYAKEWLEISMAYAKENKLDAFVHRTARKLADICLSEDNLDGALGLVSPIVSVDDRLEVIDSRYKIYLTGVLGEIYRKQNALENARICYEKVLKKSTENRLPGWQAHAYLALGMVALQEKDFKNALDKFDKARNLYTKINQAWGKINVVTAQLLLDKADNSYSDVMKIIEWKNFAEQMNYKYNVEFFDAMLKDKEEYFQLFFL